MLTSDNALGLLLRRFLILAMVSLPVVADDFAARLSEAKAALSTDAGAAYDRTLAPIAGAAMGKCVPVGSADPKNLGAFSLVARVAPDGRLRDVAVAPLTKVSQCFRKRFGSARLAPPPKHTSKKGYPLLVEMRVVP